MSKIKIIATGKILEFKNFDEAEEYIYSNIIQIINADKED